MLLVTVEGGCPVSYPEKRFFDVFQGKITLLCQKKVDFWHPNWENLFLLQERKKDRDLTMSED